MKLDVVRTQFGADAKNQANRFTADAMNTQARFKAQAQNQFAQSRFQAANTMDTFNKGAQNQFSMADTQAENQYNLAEYGAGNQMSQFNTTAANNALKFGAQSGFDADRLSRAGDMDMQGRQYQQQADITQIRGGQSANADALVQGQQNAIRGAITGGIDSAAGFAAQGIMEHGIPESDRKLKKNIKLIGKSPSPKTAL